MSRRLLYLFAIAMVAQSVLALLALSDALMQASRSGRSQERLLAVVGLLCLLAADAAAAAISGALIRTRRTLHQQAQAMATTEALSRDWVWEADTEYRLTYSNDAVRDLLGYEPAALIGVSARELVDPEALPAVDVLMQQSMEERGTPVPDGPMELPWRHVRGHVVILQGSSADIRDERGVIVGYRGTRRVLTDAMVAERAVAAGAARVARAIAGEAVEIALQPIINVETGRLSGVEALARFRDGRPPDVWFKEATEAGMGLDLGRLTFMSALELLPVLPEACRLSINATPELLVDVAFQQRLISPDLPAERIVIEITEHARISSYDEVALALAPLRERGFQVAVDDTGAGYASLQHVLQLRPEIIKLDRSLVSRATSDAARRSVITSLVLLALDLGSSVTAEGVETPSELETLAALGADHVQGYLLARPTTDRARWAQWWDRNWLPSPTSKPDIAGAAR
jgi:PAS domain S-box-containing protein